MLNGFDSLETNVLKLKRGLFISKNGGFDQARLKF